MIPNTRKDVLGCFWKFLLQAGTHMTACLILDRSPSPGIGVIQTRMSILCFPSECLKYLSAVSQKKVYVGNIVSVSIHGKSIVWKKEFLSLPSCFPATRLVTGGLNGLQKYISHDPKQSSR